MALATEELMNLRDARLVRFRPSTLQRVIEISEKGKGSAA
jgi:hypothetical protein